MTGIGPESRTRSRLPADQQTRRGIVVAMPSAATAAAAKVTTARP
ncbi:MAG TPA: hypothetical protein VGG35_25710 [Streptosporangiaceae bacterium]|jgi:hypothetical protein